MKSWLGNTLRTTSPLCGESTSERWIPQTNRSNVGLWWFLLLLDQSSLGTTNREASEQSCNGNNAMSMQLNDGIGWLATITTLFIYCLFSEGVVTHLKIEFNLYDSEVMPDRVTHIFAAIPYCQYRTHGKVHSINTVLSILTDYKFDIQCNQIRSDWNEFAVTDKSVIDVILFGMCTCMSVFVEVVKSNQLTEMIVNFYVY